MKLDARRSRRRGSATRARRSPVLGISRHSSRKLGLLQLDFVNVLVPSHYLVPFSRLGPYDRAALDRVVYGGREFTEQWAHEASIIPVETWPLLRHRRDTHIARPWGFDDIMAEHQEYVETAVGEITRRGPLGSSNLPDPSTRAGAFPSRGTAACPGRCSRRASAARQLAFTARRENFSRVFDLAERVIPKEHYHRHVDGHESQRERSASPRAAAALEPQPTWPTTFV